MPAQNGVTVRPPQVELAFRPASQAPQFSPRRLQPATPNDKRWKGTASAVPTNRNHDSGFSPGPRLKPLLLEVRHVAGLKPGASTRRQIRVQGVGGSSA